MNWLAVLGTIGIIAGVIIIPLAITRFLAIFFDFYEDTWDDSKFISWCFGWFTPLCVAIISGAVIGILFVIYKGVEANLPEKEKITQSVEVKVEVKDDSEHEEFKTIE
jgi:hypothetical protein